MEVGAEGLFAARLPRGGFGVRFVPAGRKILLNLRAKQAWCELSLEMFRAIEPEARTGFFEDDQLYPYVSLLYGIELLEWMHEWCGRTAERIARGELPPRV